MDTQIIFHLYTVRLCLGCWVACASWVVHVTLNVPPRYPAGPASKKVPAKSKGKAAADSKKKTSAVARKPPAKQAPAKKSPARKSTGKQTQSDEEISDADIEVSVEGEEPQQETQGVPESTQDEQPGTSQSAKGKKGSKRAAANRPGPGSVKAGAIAGTPNFSANTTWFSTFVLSTAFQSHTGTRMMPSQCRRPLRRMSNNHVAYNLL